MEHIIVAVRAVVPTFLVILLGAFSRIRGWIGEEDVLHFNKVCFSLFLPCLFSYNLYAADLETDFDLALILFIGMGIVVSWLISLALAALMPATGEQKGVLALAFSISNYILLAIPMVQSIYGGSAMGKTAMMVGFTIPINNILGVISVEMFRGGQMKLGKTLRGILTNPLVMGCLGGLALNLLNIPLPAVAESALQTVGAAASPLMLFLVGGYFTRGILSGQRRNLAAATVVRLVLMPALAVVLAVLLGFRGLDLLLILINFGTPVGVLVFSLASQMGGDVRLSCMAIVGTTAASCLTMSGWLILLMNLGLL